MDGFDHILNWKLQPGSHPFPGKDGGTCINEAAIVAAGFEYQPVRRVEDMPDCFSRQGGLSPIGASWPWVGVRHYGPVVFVEGCLALAGLARCHCRSLF